MFDDTRTRRQFVCVASAAAGSLLLTPAAFGQKKPAAKPEEGKNEAVSPAEDLMREHGVLRRILLIYEEISLRIAQHGPADPQDLARAAHIIRKFVEDYHEKLEEEFLFPRFEKAGKLTELVGVLKQQHQIGRDLTSRILAQATPANFHDENARRVTAPVEWFIRLYRPHAAREDTVLFPAFRKLVSPKEYDELGDRFETREDQLFGKDGFETVVAGVEELEKKLGIYDLAQFNHPRSGGVLVPKPAGAS